MRKDVKQRVRRSCGPRCPQPLDTDPPMPAQQDAVPVISSALEKQIGFKLEAAKIPGDIVVIDHSERTPVEN